MGDSLPCPDIAVDFRKGRPVHMGGVCWDAKREPAGRASRSRASGVNLGTSANGAAKTLALTDRSRRDIRL